MLCQNCQKRTANVHFTQIINNSKVELYLCEECAREKGQVGLGSHFSLNDFFPGLLGFTHAAAPYVDSVPQKQVCEKCGMTYDEFQNVGKLGCNRCYELFGEKLKPLLKRLHGSTEHHGKVPGALSQSIKTSRELENLKSQLNDAIKSEEYEKAAELRDRIRKMETGV